MLKDMANAMNGRNRHIVNKYWVIFQVTLKLNGIEKVIKINFSILIIYSYTNIKILIPKNIKFQLKFKKSKVIKIKEAFKANETCKQ